LQQLEERFCVASGGGTCCGTFEIITRSPGIEAAKKD